MKINKMVSLDLEIFMKLKEEENTSKLINDLLKEYYDLLKEL